MTASERAGIRARGGGGPSGTAGGPPGAVPPTPSNPHPTDPRARRREAAGARGPAGLPVRARGLRGAPAAPKPQFPSALLPCQEGGPQTGADKNKTGRGPLLGLDGRDPNIPQRHDLRPLPSNPEQPPASPRRWRSLPLQRQEDGPPASRPAGRSSRATEGPCCPPPRTAAPPANPGTSAPGIRRDSPPPPPPYLLIGCENQQVSRGRGRRDSQ